MQLPAVGALFVTYYSVAVAAEAKKSFKVRMILV